MLKEFFKFLLRKQRTNLEKKAFRVSIPYWIAALLLSKASAKNPNVISFVNYHPCRSSFLHFCYENNVLIWRKETSRCFIPYWIPALLVDAYEILSKALLISAKSPSVISLFASGFSTSLTKGVWNVFVCSIGILFHMKGGLPSSTLSRVSIRSPLSLQYFEKYD